MSTPRQQMHQMRSATRSAVPSAVRSVVRPAILLLVLALPLAACVGDEPLEGADTGNIAGGSVYDPSASPQGPDSTLGVTAPTNESVPSGDTLTADIKEGRPVNAGGDTIQYGRPPR